jgi:tight adherence protein B
VNALLPATAALLAALVIAPPRLARWRRPTLPLPRRRAPGGDVELAWLDAVVEELRSGRDPASSVLVAAEDWPACPSAQTAARAGEDIADALDQDAARSRHELLSAVAAAWRVGQGTGAGLAAALGSLADSAREAHAVRAELRVGVAEPRATAVVLALLPAAGLVLGWLLGADPLAWLLGTPAGRVVLLAGVALDLVGAAWSWRIVRGLEASV